MGNRVVKLRGVGPAVMAGVVVGLLIGYGQQAGAQRGGASPAPAAAFDPRDFSGIWNGNSYAYANTEPKFTAEGRARNDANKPSYGRPAGSEPRPGEPAGRRRAVPPAVNTDYVGACNPLGLVRNLVYNPAPTEFVHVRDRILQRFEWTWDQREIWLDGRVLPNVDDYLPRFNGYSVGQWEGDELVVETVGLDDRQWLDHFGYPVSVQARLVERYRRTAPDTIELRMTLNDPLFYAEPWEADLVTFGRVPRDRATVGGWYGLLEDRCVPFDEVDQFNERVRNPAAGR
jgi:hypothetical protein